MYKKRKPRILFFIPTLVVGGAERHTVELRERLHARGFESDLLVHGRNRSHVIMQMEGAKGAVFLNLRGMSDLRGWLTVWKEIRRLKPDVILAINQTPLIVSVVIRFLLGTRAKIGCIFHTTRMQAYERSTEKLFRYTIPFSDILIYVGKNQSRIWADRGIRSRRAQVINNGIEVGRFSGLSDLGLQIREKYGIKETDLLLGIVASFRQEKNHVELVEALAAARRCGIGAKALMVGDGPTQAEVKELALALGIGDHIVFTGEQAVVGPFMAACDVGILCSTSETFPLSALEFLASGIPMISARVGGASEIVLENVNGLLYEQGRIDQFAECIVALSDPCRRSELAANALASVESYSDKAMVDQYENVIMQITNQ